jgi:hypothetical protein
LPLTYSKLPGDILTSNLSLANAIKLGAYYRSDLSLNISVAGTITHSGLILAAILPPLPVSISSISSFFPLINTALSGPHAFLSANEASSVMLHVPWYCNSDLSSLDLSKTDGVCTALDISTFPGNFGTLVLIVMNPLMPSDGSSTSLEIVVEAFFNSLDILVPSPRYITYTNNPPTSTFKSQSLLSIGSSIADSATSFVKETIGDGIDRLRKSFFNFTGLHNVNTPNINNRHIVGKRNFPNVTDSPQFFEKLDPYCNIDRILQKPEFNSYTDEMSIKHIISKRQFLGTFRVNDGDRVGTLLWCRPISPFQGGVDPFRIIINNNIETLHFLSRGWRGPISIHIQSVMNNKQQVKLRLMQLYNPSIEIGSSYPEYRSILNAPSHLMEFTSGNQIQTIKLPYLCRNNITPCMRDMSSESLFHGEYYIYLAQPMANSSGSPRDIYFNVYISLDDEFKFYGYSTELAYQTPYFSQSLNVMNEPQDQSSLIQNQNSLQNQEYQERLYAPLDIRPIIRRMYNVDKLKIASRTIAIIKLDNYIGEYLSTSSPVSPLQIIGSMFYGKHVGLKIKLKYSAAKNIVVRHLPPNYFVDSNSQTILNCEINSLDLTHFTEQSTSYPIPFQEIPILFQLSNDTSLAEADLIIPNNSFYKFVGSPAIFSRTQPNTPSLSIASLGYLIISYEDETPESIQVDVYMGASDESRFGFHSLAPILLPITDGSVINTAYSGNFLSGSTTQPSVERNKFLYFQRN